MLLSPLYRTTNTLPGPPYAIETPLAIVAKPDKLNELLTSYGLESLRLYPTKISKKNHFCEIPQKEEYGDNFIDTLYWDIAMTSISLFSA